MTTTWKALRFVVFPLLLTMAACVESATYECATPNGPVICGPAQVCLASGNGCATPEQAQACADKRDGTACTAKSPEIAAGLCNGGACRAIVCGDNEVGFGEQCDDGNIASGDGCSSNCASNEQCGNRVLDPYEACDDGNRIDGDGCQSDCKISTCGDGKIDAVFGEQCDDGNHDSGDGCAGNCRSNETCGNGFIDVASGEQCDDGAANSDNADAPCRRDCKTRRCGDGVKDSNEVCDDGNRIDGDGCAAGCDSAETCGNAIVDARVGEQCDEGVPGLSGDGCNSTCKLEFESWQDVSPTLPSARTYHTMVYDTHRARVVMFGGYNENLGAVAETWEFDGLTWVRRTPAVTPQARAYHVMAYDSARRVTVLFGGLGSTYLDDTWEWDGSGWTLRDPAHRPAVRAAPAMAYDPVRRVTVLFGGVGTVNNIDLNDVWEFDGTDWRDVSTAVAPPARYYHAMAYDPSRQEILLVGGGFGANVTELADAWTWNGSRWQQLAAGTPQGATRYGVAMAFDAARNRMVLFGGVSNGFDTDEVWELAPTGWIARAVLSEFTPQFRSFGTMVFDTERQALLLFGGSSNNAELDDLWRLRADSWTRHVATAAPPARFRAAATYDRRRARTLMFGGLTNGDAAAADFWQYDGVGWQQLLPSQLPPPRADAAMVYDARRDRVVLFGGLAGSQKRADTWEFDGTTWTQRAPAQAPMPRYGHTMVYDDARGVVVLFGGNGNNYLNDTWEYDGNNWTQRAPTQTPPLRYLATMTYDPRRQVTVLFGGINAETRLDDTWEYDGNDWVPVNTPHRPAPRTLAASTYHHGRQAMLMFAGYNNDNYDDVWQYDGADWVQLASAIAPLGRNAPALAYDNRTGDLIVFGGFGDGVRLDDTWRWRFSRAGASRDTCESATSDSDGDGRIACGTATSPPDPDCWAICTPSCAPWTTAVNNEGAVLTWPAACALAYPGASSCGDGVCSAPLENRHICPGDCL